MPARHGSPLNHHVNVRRPCERSPARAATGNYQALSFNLDVFKSQDLRAYVTSVHRLCVRRAVEQIAKELGQDTSGFDWKSKGFLQVW